MKIKYHSDRFVIFSEITINFVRFSMFQAILGYNIEKKVKGDTFMYWTKRIRDLREDHDLSKKELADQLGISERTLSRYEAGTSEPTISVIIQLALMFNISADYICGITEEMNIKDPSVKDDIIDLLDKLNAIAKRL